jgi:hypothetical protein
MKFALLIPLVIAAWAGASHAQTQVYRCAGNLYTTDLSEAKSKGCKTMEGGNITVVQGTRVNGNAGNANAVRVAVAPQAVSSQGQRVEADEQRARDSDARGILEAELKKAEARQAELVKEYNGGEPEKQGAEHRNNQKYLDRIAELKANIARTENDIAGLKRELSRVASK